ncbi:hypothetical protein MRX96_035992 [Rhipicephalus microplus]
MSCLEYRRVLPFSVLPGIGGVPPSSATAFARSRPYGDGFVRRGQLSCVCADLVRLKGAHEYEKRGSCGWCKRIDVDTPEVCGSVMAEFGAIAAPLDESHVFRSVSEKSTLYESSLRLEFYEESKEVP